MGSTGRDASKSGQARTAKILFLADTHLGFDMPQRPRVTKPRRGADFLASFRRALRPARERRVDLVVHGGDLFFRSRVRTSIVMQAIDDIRAVTESGVPFVIIPGNHERSALPYPLLWQIPGVSVFDRPRSFVIEVGATTVRLAGFPCVRRNARDIVPRLARDLADLRITAGRGIHLLCMHQTVAGATVGPDNFTFRRGHDVTAGQHLPRGFAAVLSGHIHRRQILSRDLGGGPLPCPVVYPGSTERTSFAERDEPKGFFVLDVEETPCGTGQLTRCTFVELPTRPMVDLAIAVDGQPRSALEARLRQALAGLDPASIVRLRVNGTLDGDRVSLFAAAALRDLAPTTMNIQFAWRGTTTRSANHSRR